jgi:hypothetical protein
MPKDHSQPSKLTLENLLQLKRRERPPEAFWNEFDARLREKQLAALIPVDSGWARWFGGFGRVAKFGLPLAAVAAVAVAFVTIDRQAWQGSSVAVDGSGVADREISHATQTAVVDSSREESGVRTVVIEVAPAIAELASDGASSGRQRVELNADQIARTLPWLANVDFKRETNDSGIKLVEPLNIDRGPTAVAMSTFESIKPNNQPVWVPTEQNLREAVASEFGISSSRGDNANRAWMTRVIASNTAAKFVSSRIESEEPRELTRVGVTGSTLSIKF